MVSAVRLRQMSRASEDALAALHGAVAETISDFLQDDDPRQRLAAVDRAIRFLKDNNITATVEASEPLRSIADQLPTAEELEKLMQLSPE